MSTAQNTATGRRRFLQTAAGVIAAGAAGRMLARDGRPPVIRPRATSGDTASEPDWSDRLTITVGPREAQLVGSDDRVIQAGVDYMARLGGGTVRVMPGTYRLRNSVYLQSGVRILGSGGDSVLLKEPSTTTKLAADSDWYDQEITLVDPTGFRVGDGVCVRAMNPHNKGRNVAKRILVARSGSRFKLDRPLRKNYWLSGEASVSTLFPIFGGEYIEDVAIENITLDGNKKENERLDGNYAGCIFLQDCRRITMRGVEARNYHGDGISWQICHDVIVENCYSHDNTDLGLHPGSGSQRPLMRENRLERNRIGIFFCWGVKYGLAEKNVCEGNTHYGVSVGHRDTDNLIRDNDIRMSGKVGVLFRKERGKAYAPHRNVVEGNRIVDSGADDGVAIDVQGETESIVIRSNDLRETRGPGARTGVRIGPETRDVRLAKNRFEGFRVKVENQH